MNKILGTRLGSDKGNQTLGGLSTGQDGTALNQTGLGAVSTFVRYQQMQCSFHLFC